MTERKSYNTSW